MNFENHILSISGYLELLNEQLKLFKVKVIGEVTKVNIYPSGHVYFTVKDKTDGSVLDCILWKSTYRLYGIKLETGMEVILQGHANVYPQSGRLSFIASSIELVGEGALFKAYTELRRKLENEGLFLAFQKKPIPAFPQKIGVITSAQGAVIHDFTNNLSPHGFKVSLIDTRVEGPEALGGLINALQTMKRQDVDVIVIMRGGGSLQSLSAFDTEVMVREIVRSHIPIIAAIGHHQDVPLACLASDAATSTPTAAATLLSASWDKGLNDILKLSFQIPGRFKDLLSDTKLTVQVKQEDISERFDCILAIFHKVVENMPAYLSRVAMGIERSREGLTRVIQHTMTHMSDAVSTENELIQRLWSDRLCRLYTISSGEAKRDLISLDRLIQTHNPERLLSLGYSLARIEGKGVIRSVQNAQVGDTIELTVSDGSFQTHVTKVNDKAS